MLTPIVGVLILVAAMSVAFMERRSGQLDFFDWHAAAVVFGGVIGALCLAIDRKSLGRMLTSLRDLLPSTSAFTREMSKAEAELTQMRLAWRAGRRTEILTLAENASSPEMRVAAEALLNRRSAAVLAEEFTQIRADYIKQLTPPIEGWEMVTKLAPSFGMVGTVTGMVQLFRNMADQAGNLGGAMAMALLATLYGIATGAAIGGPMASRMNNQLNSRLAMVELLEKTVAALISEEPQKR